MTETHGGSGPSLLPSPQQTFGRLRQATELAAQRKALGLARLRASVEEGDRVLSTAPQPRPELLRAPERTPTHDPDPTPPWARRR